MKQMIRHWYLPAFLFIALLSSCGSGGLSPIARASYSNYDGVVIDPIMTRFATDDGGSKVHDQLAYEIRDGLRAAFRKRLRLTGVQGPNTLRVRAIMSDGTPDAPVVRHAHPRKAFRGDLGSAAPILQRAHFSGEILDANGRKLASVSGVQVAPARGFRATSSWVEIALITDTLAESLANKLPIEGPFQGQ